MSEVEMWVPKGNKSYEALDAAVTKGDSQELLAALSADVDVNALYGHPPHDGWTALHTASSKGYSDVVRILLSHGARVNAKAIDRHPEGHGDEPPLYYAARAAFPETVRILLDAGAEITVKPDRASLPVATNLVLTRCVQARVSNHAVKAEQRHIDTINLLLDAGFDVDHTPDPCRGASLIQQAVQLDDINLIKLLVDRGASVHSSLMRIQSWLPNSVETIAFLLERGAKIEYDQALDIFAGQGNLEIILLLAKYTNISESKHCVDALTSAASYGHEGVVKAILDWGVDINSLDQEGATALLAACRAQKPSVEVIKLLLEKGADVSLPDSDPSKPARTNYFQRKPLHALTRTCDPEAIHTLLNAGADLELRNNVGETPLITLASALASPLPSRKNSSARLVVFQLFLEAGSDVNAVDSRGHTALHKIASIGGDNELEIRLACAKLLVLNGADTGVQDGEGKRAVDLSTSNNVEFSQLLNLWSTTSIT